MGTDFTNDDLVKESSLRKDFAARIDRAVIRAVAVAPVFTTRRRKADAMPQNLGFDVELPLAFNDAVGRVKDALKQVRLRREPTPFKG